MLKNKTIILFCLLCFSCLTRFDNDLKKTSSLKFDIDQLVINEDKSELSLNLEIPINKLVFSKKNDGFYSQITIDVFILDENKKKSYACSWDENIKLNYFEDTKDKKPYLVKHLFELPIGVKYSVNVTVNDFLNHLSFLGDKEFTVNDDNYLADLLLYYKNNDEFFKYSIDSDIAGLDTLWVKYETIQRNIKNETDNIKLSYEFMHKNSIVFSYTINDEVLIKEKNKYYTIPLINKAFDKLKIEILFNDQIRSEVFEFKSVKVDNFDIEKLIGPMQYVLNYREFIYFVDLPYQEQIEFIENFWDIDENKKFIEFYSRVEYANNNFVHYNMDGWKSDRGKIYIINGEPREIKHDFNEKGEFEIWYYDSNKRYVFLNKFGFYELYYGDR